MSKKLEDENTIANLNEQHKLFILKEVDLNPDFHLFRLFYRTQVDMGQVWQVYRDGMFYAQLTSGPHTLWNALWHKWRAQIVNLRIVQLHFTAQGRVKGPQLPAETPGATSVDLGCNVSVKFDLSCKIADIGTYLQFEDPLSAFSASLNNMVHEMIGRLNYDQYGEWATQLRNYLRERLRGGSDDAERHIGLRVEDVFITKVEPNSITDRTMLAMYQQVERARRELAEAQANRQRDKEVAQSFADQGSIMDISPAILALQNSSIGKELIQHDAHLREMMIGVGLNPGVSITPIRDFQQHPGGPSQGGGYLNPPRPNPNTNSSPSGVLGQTGYTSGPTSFDSQSGPIPSSPFNTIPGSAQPVDSARQDQELAALNAAGYFCTGKLIPTFDSLGQPVPGSMEWVLEVYIQRVNGYLTIVFHSPPGYPSVPPRVQARPPVGGGLTWITPNTVSNWNASRLLVEVAQEIDNSTI